MKEFLSLKHINISNRRRGPSLIDVDKMTHEDAAKKWLADNESVWKAF